MKQRPAITTLIILAFSVLSACGQLYTVVTPGYQFPLDGSVPATYQLLNLLAEPTIAIYGTVGGSNSLAPGSVTGVSLSDNLPDGVTIVYNGASPRQLQVRTLGLANGYNGIVVSNNLLLLNFDATTFGLATNSPFWTNSTPYTNQVFLILLPGGVTDTNIWAHAAIQSTKIVLTNNTIAWGGTNGYVTGSNAAMTGLILSPEFTVGLGTNSTMNTDTNVGPALWNNRFVSPLITISGTGSLYDQPHGFANTPSRVRVVLVCQTAEAGYAIGDEVDIHDVFQNGAAGADNWTQGANSTNVFLNCHATSLQIYSRVNNTIPALTTANWRAKIYAWP